MSFANPGIVHRGYLLSAFLFFSLSVHECFSNLFSTTSIWNIFRNTTNSKIRRPQSWSPGPSEQILLFLFLLSQSKIKWVAACQRPKFYKTTEDISSDFVSINKRNKVPSPNHRKGSFGVEFVLLGYFVYCLHNFTGFSSSVLCLFLRPLFGFLPGIRSEKHSSWEITRAIEIRGLDVLAKTHTSQPKFLENWKKITFAIFLCLKKQLCGRTSVLEVGVFQFSAITSRRKKYLTQCWGNLGGK